MADNAAAPPKPSSSVKLVLLGEAAVGKVRRTQECIIVFATWQTISLYDNCDALESKAQLILSAEAVVPRPPLRQQ